jgi:signal transduction histidine kinase
MSSRWHERLTRTFGVRLALWYFGVFLGGSLLVVALAYVLLDLALRRQDREVIASTLSRYAAAYQAGGLPALDRAIGMDREGGRLEPLFVRVLSRDGSAVYFRMPASWVGFDLRQLAAPPLHGDRPWAELRSARTTERLTVASRWISGGTTLLQVGRSDEGRRRVLARFRSIGLMLLGAVVCAGLAGGLTLTAGALRPLRDLTTTVRSILERGPAAARVPVRGHTDALDELGVLVNRMLDRIESLVAGMRASLDNVAHDLRTPVTRLRGTAEAALRNAATLEECRGALADCVEESERVMTMLNALMDLAEAETGVMQLRPEPIDVRDLVQDAVELYAPVAEEKQVALQVDVPAGLRIEGDRNRLAQVVANLLDNAVKYTPPDGRIVVSATWRPERGAEITVADNGAGIAQEDLPRIWDRLYRGDRSRSQRGLGLGLSLVKAIVRAHGGTVAVASTPGEGSTFTLRLPSSPPTPARS